MTGLGFLLTQCLYPRDEHPKKWDKYVYDSEFLHKVILKILMETDLHFAEKILNPGVPLTSVHVKHEPEHGLFDLLVKTSNANYYVEIKIWAALTEKQFNNQTKFLKENNARGVYILLANAADRWSNSMVNEKSGSRSHVTDIGDLLRALNVFEIAKPSLKEIEEIATVYGVVLGACPTLPKLAFLGVAEPFIMSKSLILSQICASDFSRFLMSDRLLEHLKSKR